MFQFGNWCGKRKKAGIWTYGHSTSQVLGWNKHQEKWLNLTMEFGKPFMFPTYDAEPS
jgi:hypothetical protein